MTQSPDGTLAIQPVTDRDGTRWEIRIGDGSVQPWGTPPTGGIAILRNGVLTNGGATQIKLENGGIAYFLGRNGNWWTSSALNVWADVGPADPGIVLPPAGIPVSADYIPKAQSKRAQQQWGGSAGWCAMKRLATGMMIAFGMSHDPSENNAVETYDVIADEWTIRIPHTVAGWPPIPGTVAGRSFKGNSDNQVNIALREHGLYYVNDGQRGSNFDANWRGWVDTTRWTWAGISDDPEGCALFGGVPAPVWNGVGEWVDALHVGVIYGGTQGNCGDYLNIITPTPQGPAKFSLTRFEPDQGGNPSFPGAVKLRYMSQSNWVRGTKLHIYGGQVQDRSGGAITDNATIYELDITGAIPVMRAISTNTLPVAQQVKGDGILGDLWTAKDMAVISDGRKVNVYDYATDSWHFVPINGLPGSNFLSPDPLQGTGLQARWAPEIAQMIVLGLNGATAGIRLNFA